MATTKRKSRVYTISLPPDLAKQAEAIAKAESRTMSEVFREGIRAIRAERLRKEFERLAEYGAKHNPNNYTEEDVVRLVKEVRAEMAAERKIKAAG